jgi:phytoene dehydrogenase-like protein
VVIVGGGHNGLTSAAYLARAGKSVLVLERLAHTGGAAVSPPSFSGLPARPSRYSDLVGLMPEQLIRDLDLGVELRSRSTASYTPWLRDGEAGGLLVERPEGEGTRASLRELTGGDEEYAAWQDFYGRIRQLAEVVQPTLLEPLALERTIRDQVDAAIWQDFVTEPIGRVIERTFRDDVVRGVVATDAVIGTFASMHDGSLVQNRCFLYHLIGDGTGEWKVPVGGMGAVTDALLRAARSAGAEVTVDAGVSSIKSDGETAEVTWDDNGRVRSVTARHVLSNVAPWVLGILLGEPEAPELKPSGSQIKINLLLERLPRLKSGLDPAIAFAGTLHLAETYTQLETAYNQAAAGMVPRVVPGEVFCHSLTDNSILGGFEGQILTYFGLHTPAVLFEQPTARAQAVSGALAAMNTYFAEPIEGCLARDDAGNPCIEVKVPQDVEADLAMPGGHIFHGDLDWPWASNRGRLDTPAQQWGVATDVANVFLCGAGARRGGAVSGIGGHNAAQAVLASA